MIVISDVARLADYLKDFVKADGATSWSVIQGPHGYSSIVIYDKDGMEITTICNKG